MEAEAASFKKLEAEAEAEAEAEMLHAKAEAEAEAVKNSPLPHHWLWQMQKGNNNYNDHRNNFFNLFDHLVANYPVHKHLPLKLSLLLHMNIYDRSQTVTNRYNERKDGKTDRIWIN